jgi:hypothetical protein
MVPEKSSPVQDKTESWPIVKIVWYSCVFFLLLFTFYAWKLFIKSSPRALPWWLMTGFYALAVVTYIMAELMSQNRNNSKHLPPQFLQMVAYSMFEAVGLYGLIFAVIAQNFGQALVFLLASLVGLVRHKP